MRTGRVLLVRLALLGFVVSCNFDAAFKRYCENNPRCLPDSGIRPEAGTGPDSGSGLEAGTGPDSESGLEAGTGPEAGIGPEAGQSFDVNVVDATQFIPTPKNCGPSTPCVGPREVCHPFGQVCMQTCTSSADCPPWLDTCAEIPDSKGPGHASKVCNCTSGQVCNNYASGFTCNPSDNLCEPLCASPQDCSGFQPARTCVQKIGVCLSTSPPCFSSAECPSAAQPRCDPVSSRCVGCLMPSDCAGRPDSLTQCSSDGSCVSQ